MQIQINTDRNIDGDEAMIEQADSVVRTTLGRLANR
jgi:hypothetical protein